MARSVAISTGSSRRPASGSWKRTVTFRFRMAAEEERTPNVENEAGAARPGDRAVPLTLGAARQRRPKPAVVVEKALEGVIHLSGVSAILFVLAIFFFIF